MELNIISMLLFIITSLLIVEVSGQLEPDTPKPRVRPKIRRRSTTPRPLPPPMENDENASSLSDPSFRSIPSSPSDRGICTQEGYISYPNDCTKFIRCVDESQNPLTTKFIKYEFDCAIGTVYDPTISNCNFPNQGGTPFGCEAKYPIITDDDNNNNNNNESESPSSSRKRLGRRIDGPDQKGGGHYKYIYFPNDNNHENLNDNDFIDLQKI